MASRRNRYSLVVGMDMAVYFYFILEANDWESRTRLLLFELERWPIEIDWLEPQRLMDSRVVASGLLISCKTGSVATHYLWHEYSNCSRAVFEAKKMMALGYFFLSRPNTQNRCCACFRLTTMDVKLKPRPMQLHHSLDRDSNDQWTCQVIGFSISISLLAFSFFRFKENKKSTTINNKI